MPEMGGIWRLANHTNGKRNITVLLTQHRRSDRGHLCRNLGMYIVYRRRAQYKIGWLLAHASNILLVHIGDYHNGWRSRAFLQLLARGILQFCKPKI
jgi:hypothetical protein